MAKALHITIVAPSGVVPMGELEAGVARLRGVGAVVEVPAGLDERHFVFAGGDAARGRRFWEAAWGENDVIWAARGGYGAARLLPELERWTLADGVPPKKLLCGYSDITALHEFVRSRWGWSTLHCAMPGGKSFVDLPEDVFRRTLALAAGEMVGFGEMPVLQAYGPEPLIDLVGTMVGGNMTVLASLVGTPFAVDNSGGRFLFVEDVSEAPYRLDRYLHQLYQAGVFTGVRAMVLGTFHDCVDTPPTTVVGGAAGAEKVAVRPALSAEQWGRHVWAEFSRGTKIPVLGTLPVGHGPEKMPLPMGAKYRLTGAGRLELVKWDWER